MAAIFSRPQCVNQVYEVPYQISPTKFELNLISGLSADAQKLLNQSEARKWWKIGVVYPKVNQVEGGL